MAPPAKLRLFVRISALAAILTGIAVILSWAFGFAPLQKIDPNLVSMNPLTALSFILLGISLELGIRAPAVIVLVLGLIRILGVAGPDLELDRFLFTEYLGQNRMAPNTALGVSLLALALLFPKRAEKFAFAGFLVSFLAIAGYLFGVRPFYGLGKFIPMAFHTGFTFLYLSLGVLFKDPTQEWVSLFFRRDLGGKLIRTLLPAIVFVPLILGWASQMSQKQDLLLPEITLSLFTVVTVFILAVITGFSAKTLSAMDREFRKQDQIYKIILDSVGEALVVADRDGNFTYYNQTAADLTGIGQPGIVPRSDRGGSVVLMPDKKTKIAPEDFPMAQALRGKSTNRVELYFQNSQSKILKEGGFISVTGRPLLDEEGQNQGAVCIFRDITQEKETESRLRASNLDLEQKISDRVNELKEMEGQMRHLQKMDAVGRLAGGMAHDFNNILGAIRLYCDFAETKINDPEGLSKSLKEMINATERGAALTRQLLIFSRKQVIDSKTLDLHDVVGPLLKMVKRILGENIKLETEFESNIDPIKADPAQLEQVLMNLLVNARDAMPDGGTIHLKIENVVLDAGFTNTHLTVNPGPHVLLTVTDTGVGMSAETLERLFEPFFTTKPVGKGTGLGLLTVYGIVKQAKGSIWVSSKPGYGTVFKVYIPSAERRHSSAEPGVEKKTSLKPKKGGESVLIVEDEDNLRSLICEVLHRQGYQVLKATNGREALQVLKDHPSGIQLVLTDMIMPEMGGMELVRQAQILKPDIRTLYMSGYTDAAFDAKLSGTSKTTALFIQKPFSSSLLIERVRQVLDS